MTKEQIAELKKRAEACLLGFPETTPHRAFIAAATPETVLSLIADIERLKSPPHHGGKQELIDMLETSSKALSKNGVCQQCDPSVGFQCESCYASWACSRAAGYISAFPEHAEIENMMKQRVELNLLRDHVGHLKKILDIIVEAFQGIQPPDNYPFAKEVYDARAHEKELEKRMELFVQAVGMTVAEIPGMKINADDPVGMMRGVVSRMKELEEKLRDGPSVHSDGF